MNIFKWMFMSKYKKLMYSLTILKDNQQAFHLENGIILDFENMIIKEEQK